MEQDVDIFMQHLLMLDVQPRIYKEDGETLFEWIFNRKHAIVSLDGDGYYGYTMLQDSVFVSDAECDPPVSRFSHDLLYYINGKGAD